MYCLYYQVEILKEHIQIVTAIMRSFEHLCFDSMLRKSLEDNNISIFEFFVPEQLSHYFVDIMKRLKQEKYIQNFVLCSNRLKQKDI